MKNIKLTFIAVTIIMAGCIYYYSPIIKIIFEDTILQWNNLEISVPNNMTYSKYDNGFVFSLFNEDGGFFHVKSTDKNLNFDNFLCVLESEGYTISSRMNKSFQNTTSVVVQSYNLEKDKFMKVTFFKHRNLVFIYEGNSEEDTNFKQLIEQIKFL